MLTSSNKAPTTKWFTHRMSCGVVRHKLYLNGEETPYFVDDARDAGQGHRMYGYKVGLHGAGMGEEIRCHDGSAYRIAAFLAGFGAVTPAKMRAEQMALK